MGLARPWDLAPSTTSKAKICPPILEPIDKDPQCPKAHGMKIAVVFAIAALQVSCASLYEVGPLVGSVVTGSPSIEPSGEFYRAVLMNIESDACLTLQRVSTRITKTVGVKETKKLCSFRVGKEVYSLLPERFKSIDYGNLAWKGFVLNFDLTYGPAEAKAIPLKLNCKTDARQNNKDFVCAVVSDGP
jgi:hypothetical protein